MRRKIVASLLIIITLTVLPIAAYAHPGRTDSQGGHTNSSTGEYHYHHGYPEHQHYDMDGDGVIDCPYDFDDKTGANSGSSSSRKSSGSGSAKDATPTSTTTTSTNSNKGSDWEVIGWIVSAVLVLALFISSRFRKSEREAYDHQYDGLCSKYDGVKAAWSNTISAISNSENLSSWESFKLRYANWDADKIEIPDHVWLDENDTPIRGHVNSQKPFGDYTVYISYSGSCYHSRCGCSGATTLAHGLDVADHLRPCSRCMPYIFNISEIKLAATIERIKRSKNNFLNEHGIKE